MKLTDGAPSHTRDTFVCPRTYNILFDLFRAVEYMMFCYPFILFAPCGRNIWYQTRANSNACLPTLAPDQ